MLSRYPIRLLLISFLLLTGWTNPVSAQLDDLRFERISEKYNLLHGRIEHLMEDDHGFLWLSTREGIFRYDGYSFKEFVHNVKDSTTLSHPYVRFTFQDESGRIWAGTTYGLNLLDPLEETFQYYLPFPEFGKSSKIKNITFCAADAGDGKLYVGTNSGLLLFDPETGQFKTYKPPEQVTRFASLRSLLKLGDGTVWGTAGSGLIQIKDPNREPKYYELTLPSGKKFEHRIYGITEDRNGRLILASSGKVLAFNPSSGVIESVIELPTNNDVSSVMVDRADNLWITVDQKGVYVKSSGTTEMSFYENIVNQPFSLLANTPRHILQDRFDNIWIATRSGLCKTRVADAGFTLMRNNPTPGHPSNHVNRILRDSQGSIWTITNDGLYKIMPSMKSGIRVKINPNLPDNISVSSFTIDPDDQIWLAVVGIGLYKKQATQEYFQRVSTSETLSNHFIYKMIIDNSNDSVVWVGTTQGLCRLNRISIEEKWYRPKEQINELPNDRVIIFTQGSDSDLWMYYTYHNSMGRFDRSTGSFEIFKPEGEQRDALSGDLSNIEPGVDGKIWVTSLFGLTEFDTRSKSFRIFNQADGLSENELTIALKDKNDGLWICGNKVLNHYDNESKQFTKSPLDSDIKYFVSKSKFLAEDGTIFLGGMNGFYMFHPDKISTNQTRPDIVLTDFKVWNESRELNQPIEDVDKIQIDHDENNITFEFSALHFVDPDLNRYQYMLEGYDKDWSPVTADRKATYTNLRHGEYVFKIKASNSDGLWSDHPKSIELFITPAYWQTMWFKGLVLLVIFSIIYTIIKTRQHQLHLKRQKQIAEQAAEYKSKFLANVSHEVRTPMNAIIGLTDLTLDTELNQKQHKFVSTIQKSSKNLLKIINDLLDFSKLESGKFTFANDPFELRVAIEEVKEVLSPKSNKKGLEFTTNVDERLPVYLTGDKLRLNQILTNLLGNAIKFTENGFVDLSVSQVEKSDENIILNFEVSDSGMGIAPDKLKSIFDEFTQADDQIFSEFGGTGLGLSISRQFIEQQGGKLEIESAEEKGTRIWFSMPFGFAVESGTEIPVDKPTILMDHMEILLVEDNEFNRMLAIEVLKKFAPNANVEIALDGKIAFEMVAQKIFDLILMDIKMPVMNGHESTRKIRSLGNPKNSSIPIIGLTANSGKDQLRKCIESGMNDCISKPFEAQTLIEKISTVIKVPQK